MVRSEPPLFRPRPAAALAGGPRAERGPVLSRRGLADRHGRGRRGRAGPLRRALRGLALVWLAATLAATVALWRESPLTRPFAERTEAGIAVALDAALARTVDRPWLDAELDAAVAAEDVDRIESLLRLADGRGVAPSDRGAAEAALGRATGPLACTRCALVPDACASIRQVLACNLPLEMTPVGDVAALTRNGAAWATGAEVDELEAALAGAGLAATGAVLVSGGSSAGVKAGATLVRVGRRAGAIGKGLSDDFLRLARTDRAAFAAAAGEMRALRAGVGIADALAILRHADDAAEAARLVRVARAAGPEARPALAALGKARVLRLTVRLSDHLIGAVLLTLALFAQIGQMAGSLLLRRLARG